MKRSVIIHYNDEDLKVKIDSNKMVGDCYWASFNDGRHFLLQSNLNICDPITTKNLLFYFHTDNFNDICLVLKGKEDSVPIFYHLKKVFDNYVNVYSTDYINNTYVKIVESPSEDYWLIEKINEEQQAIYSIKDAKRITPFFDKINFNIPKSKSHLAQYSKDIIDKNGNVKTKLIGYVGYDGNFSSQIYDVEKNEYYSICNVGISGIKLFEEFTLFLHNQYKELDKYKVDLTNEALKNLFNQKIEHLTPIKFPQKAKIIDFKNRK